MPSLVWTHFIKGEKHYECKICKTKFAKCTRGSTGNLRRHLCNRHNIQPTQPTHIPLTPINKIFTAEETTDFETDLITLFAVANLPFRLIEQKLFRKVVQNCPKNYCFPTSKKLATLLKKKAEEINNEKKKLFQDAVSVSLSMDGWTSPNKKVHLFAVMSHVVSSDYTRRDFLLECISMTGAHTAINIASAIADVMKTFEIPDNLIVGVVADGAANLRAAVSNLAGEKTFHTVFLYHHCFCHRVHLLITRVLQANEQYELTRQKINAGITAYRRSSSVQTFFQDACLRHGVAAKRLRKDTPTRWNSHYTTLCDVIELIEPFQEMLEHLDMDPLGVENIKTMKVVRSVLFLFYQSSVTASRSSSVSTDIIASLILCKPKLKNLLLERLSTDCRSLCAAFIKETESEIVYHKDLQKLLLLDPRYAFQPALKTDTQWLMLENELYTAYSPFLSTENSSKPPLPQKPNNNLWADLKEDYFERRKLTMRDSFTEEFSQFRNLLRRERPSVEKNPLHWWSSRTEFKLIRSLTPIMLCNPAASADCERIFSSAGIIYGNKRRLRLSGHNARNLLVVAANQKHIRNEDYSKNWAGYHEGGAGPNVEIIDVSSDEEDGTGDQCEVQED